MAHAYKFGCQIMRQAVQKIFLCLLNKKVIFTSKFRSDDQTRLQGSLIISTACTEHGVPSVTNIIGTWLVRTLNQRKPKILKAEMKCPELNVLRVSELGWTSFISCMNAAGRPGAQRGTWNWKHPRGQLNAVSYLSPSLILIL